MDIRTISLIFFFFALSAARAVEFQPSIKTTPIAHSFTNDLASTGRFIRKES